MKIIESPIFWIAIAVLVYLGLSYNQKWFPFAVASTSTTPAGSGLSADTVGTRNNLANGGIVYERVPGSCGA